MLTGHLLSTARMRVGTFLAAGLLAVLPASGSAQVVEYYHLDAIANVRAVTNQAGGVVERHDYLPFGDEWNPQPGTQPKRFTGKERDAETGLDYFGARYYGSTLARFTTTDPFLDQKAALVNPQKWNRYAYSLNNPLRYVDPDGRQEAPPYQSLQWAQADYLAGAEVLTGIGKALANTILATNSPGHMTPATERNYYFQPEGAAERTAMEAVDFGLIFSIAVFTRGGRAPYAHLEDSASVGPGKIYTQAQKQAIYEANRARNEGMLRSDQSGVLLTPSEKSVKGVSTPANAAQVDHKRARSKGGTNSYSNAQVLAAKENREKGAN